MFSMDFFVRGEDEEVIHVDGEPSFGDHVMERVIHETLEHGRGVGGTKEHNSEFKETFMGDEGGLSLVTIFDADVMAPADVKLSEEFGIFQLVNEVRDEGKGVGVMNGMFIQVVVVLAGVEATITFFDKEEWECLWGI